MLIKHITVTNRVAHYLQRDGYIICDNSDYTITFTFDSEWEAHTTKTARFIWNGEYVDVTFNGNECPVPAISNATEVIVGVFAGELSSTPVIIPCEKSIFCKS